MVTATEGRRCPTQALLCIDTVPSLPSLTRQSITFEIKTVFTMDANGTRACPSSASLSAASRGNPDFRCQARGMNESGFVKLWYYPQNIIPNSARGCAPEVDPRRRHDCNSA